MKRLLICCLVWALAPYPAARSEVPARIQPIRQVSYVMGTLLEITLYHDDERMARKSLVAAFSLAQRLDSILSNYKPSSEVSRLNQKSGKGPVRVSAELYGLLSRAKKMTQMTHGAFDITVGPLTDLWDSARTEHHPPSAHQLKEAESLVGMDRIILHPNLEVELAQQGIRIDTGGIGKGYAVDLIVQLFKRSGIKSGLVNFGLSSIYAIGSPPKALAWELLVQFQEQRPLGFLRVKDQGLSASDSLGRSFKIGSHRYGHVIDPVNGLPVNERVQAMVLAPSATMAEALSKYVILRDCKNLNKMREVKVGRITGRKTIQCSTKFPLIPFASVK